MSCKLINKRELLFILTVYLTYVNLNDNNNSALKIAKKKIVRRIGKLIAIYRKSTPIDEYLKLINDGSDITDKTQHSLVLESIVEPMTDINPYIFMVLLKERLPDIFTNEIVKDDELIAFRNVFTDTMLLIPTLMFVNRLIDNVDIYVGNTPMTYNYVVKSHRKKIRNANV